MKMTDKYLLLIATLLLVGCTKPMTAEEQRAAIDHCQNLGLEYMTWRGHYDSQVTKIKCRPPTQGSEQ